MEYIDIDTRRGGIRMKLTVLVDNNTLIDRYYLGEPAVSYYIEDGEERILFDAGYSDAVIQNAEALGVALSAVTTIVISHGHDDHTRGLRYLFERFDLSRTAVVAHPDAFEEKFFEGGSIGAPFSAEEMKEKCNLHLTREPLAIGKRLVFLGEIPRLHDFEGRRPIGHDPLTDDSALAYKGEQGLFIVTGCSHSGICNIVEHAKSVCGDERVAGIIGGFHLSGLSEQLEKTIRFFKTNNISELYPCHCVSFDAKAEIHGHIPIHEVGVGLTIEA